MNRRRLFLAFLLAALGGIGVFIGPAFGDEWVTIGSVGTPDSSSSTRVQFTGTSVAFRAVESGSAIIRYNVDFSSNLDHSDVSLSLRYRDDGQYAQVIARLKEQNLQTGVITDLVVFDSNKFAQSPSFQVQTGGTTCTLTTSHPLDFSGNSYYIEVELKKSPIGGNPGVSQIRLHKIVC